MNAPVKKKLLTLIAVWAGVIAAIRFFSGLPHALIQNNLQVLIAILQIYPPVILSFIDRSPIDYWDVSRQNLIKAMRAAAVVSLLIFPLAFLANHFYQKLYFTASYHAGSPVLWPTYLLSQVILTSFPEEFFFRGYMQGVLSQITPPRRRIFGVPFGRAQVLVALMFALSHSLIELAGWHIFIFFPGLVFGWLKEKTGTIWAGMVFHAVCNAFAFWVSLHYG